VAYGVKTSQGGERTKGRLFGRGFVIEARYFISPFQLSGLLGLRELEGFTARS
jgi:hypothetical protein